MRLKKGFTLAEILIVLMVIGAIATMTVPSLMRGVTEAQWKTAYKKAFNTVLNMAALERVTGITMTNGGGANNMRQFYSVLYNNLATSGYAAAVTDETFKSGSPGSGYTILDATPVAPTSVAATGSPWIVGDDKIAYAVLSAGTCSTKAAINALKTPAAAAAASCVTVGVDTNGLLTGPNITDPQVISTAAALSTGSTRTNMNTLTGERFYIYVASDGVTAGHPEALATGRIVNDLK